MNAQGRREHIVQALVKAAAAPNPLGAFAAVEFEHPDITEEERNEARRRYITRFIEDES